MGTKIKDSLIQSHWRPLLAVAFIIIILFDFVVAPIFWSLIQALFAGSVILPWTPLTLQSGGLFYVTVCSVLGISSFTRGKEKIERLKDTSKLKEDKDTE